MSNSLEARARRLGDQLMLAESQSLSAQISGELKNEGISIARRFLSGEISLQTYREEIDVIVDSGVLLVETPSDLRAVLLSLGFEDDFVKENVGHEEEHWRLAKELGFEPKLGIRFARVNNRVYLRQVLISIDIPDTLTDDEDVRQRLRSIIKAPGENMSMSDHTLLS